MNITKEFIDSIVDLRHKLHQFPEQGREERITPEIVSKKLKEIGMKVYDKFCHKSVLGEIKKGSSDKIIMLRAELDALPIVENTGLSYTSKHDGFMHACGHDGHMAILLGSAQLLAENGKFDGTVYFLFQHSEERAGGAEEVVNSDLFKELNIQKVFALHNTPNVKEGVFSVFSGPVMASFDTFEVHITGKGGHAAFSNDLRNPITAAAHFVAKLHKYAGDLESKGDRMVLSICMFQSGSSANTVPDKCYLKGGIRTYKPELHSTIIEYIKSTSEQISKRFGSKISVNFISGSPAVINPESEAKMVQSVIRQNFSNSSLLTKKDPVMTSEDFAYFMQKYPGCYIALGCGKKTGGLHTAKYNFNDNIIESGIRFWVGLVESELK